MKTTASALGTLILLVAGVVCPEAAAAEDHPLLTPYPGSVLSRHDVEKFAEYKLIQGLEQDWSFVSEPLEGRVDRLYYENPRDRSLLEIEKNYEQALLASGMKLLFRCANEDCGPAYAASSWNRFNGIRYKTGDNCRYLAGRLSTDEAVFYVAIMLGKRRHQIDIVEIQAMETGLVTVNAEALADEIDKTGHVRIEGIFFDFNKAVLKPESAPALAEMAKLLKQRPELSVWIVGHTDNVGGLDVNLQLSRNRANAVVKALASQHGVAPERLGAHGVGPLSPQANNQSETGRALNRRVEMVAR